MLNFKFSFIIGALLLFFTKQTLAMLFEDGGCPKNLTAVGDLDMEKYQGRWYKYMVYAQVNLVNKCEYNDIEGNSTSGYTYTKHYLIASRHNAKSKIIEIDPQNGRFVLESRSPFYRNGLEMYVLDTDYESYAIQYHCFDATYINFEYASLLTRTRLPTVETVNQIESLAKASGFQVDKMRKVPQQGCPSERKKKIDKKEKLT